jgi:putative Ig domain-containing protein/putative pyrroloquinoline-quinone-binding quinoprotein
MAWIVSLPMIAFIFLSCSGTNSTSTVEGNNSDSSKAITAFSFITPTATGTIDESAKTILLTVPYGTNVTALVANFQTTGVNVKVGSTTQASGSMPNDFTNPVSYTVTAADNSTAVYTVIVTIAPNSAKTITAFSFMIPTATGTIDESAKTISVTAPYGTNVTALVATFQTTGLNVKVGSTTQVSGTTPNDFTNPVAYVITAADGSSATYTVTVTIQVPLAAPQASYMSPQVYGENQPISPLVPVMSGPATSFSVTPSLPAGLALDATTGSISGQPAAVAAAADYTITVTGPGGSTTTSLRLAVVPVVSVYRMVVASTSVSSLVTLDTAALSLSGTVYAKASDAGGVFSALVEVNPSGGNYVLELSTLSSASTGLHTGQAVVSLCRDAGCTTAQAVPNIWVNYSVNVLAPGGAWPGNHLTALSLIQGAPEWATFQGNAAHTGYVPVTLDPNQFSTRWQISVPAFLYFNGRFNLATVTTEGGNFYMSGANAVTARREYDGSNLWSYSFSGLPFPSTNPPAVSNGIVYVAAGQQSSTYMFAFDATNGSKLFQSAMSSQWDNYLAPTVGPSGVYTNAGTYGGLYAFDSQGTKLYFASTAQQSTWTPAVDSGSVYAYTGDALRVFDPVLGTLKTSISDTTFSNYIYEIGGSAVLGAANSVFAAAYGNSFLNGGAIGNSLVHFNLLSNTIDWTIKGDYPSTPAYDSGIIYAANNNPLRVEARSEVDGTLIWSWTPPASGDTGFVSEVLLTQNAVIVSTNLSTYAVDRSRHHVVWSYPTAGNLALSPNGILYIEGYGAFGSTTTLTTINVH